MRIVIMQDRNCTVEASAQATVLNEFVIKMSLLPLLPSLWAIVKNADTAIIEFMQQRFATVYFKCVMKCWRPHERLMMSSICVMSPSLVCVTSMVHHLCSHN